MDLENEIKSRLSTQFSDGAVDVEVSGNRANAYIVSKSFEGLSRVKRQQLVYSCINDLIQSGDLHAISLETKTPTEAS